METIAKNSVKHHYKWGGYVSIFLFCLNTNTVFAKDLEPSRILQQAPSKLSLPSNAEIIRDRATPNKERLRQLKGTKPDAHISPPETDLNLILSSYFDKALGAFSIPFKGKGSDKEDGSLRGSNSLTWSYRGLGASPWKEFGKGSNVKLILDEHDLQRLESKHLGNQTFWEIEIKLVAKDSHGLTGTKIIKMGLTYLL